MSFIVDAARRRQLDEEPSQAATWAYSQMRDRQRRLWIAVGLLTFVALVLTATLLIRWFAVRSADEAAVTSGTATAARPAASDAAMASTTTAEQTVDEVPYYQPLESDAPPEEVYRTPVRLADAPQSIQEALLLFSYSSHLYSSEPGSRSMSVNGQRVREGDTIDQWSVDEITEEGAIWDNGDILVEVNVLDLWQ
jgi:Type II secretion system protein B